MIELFLDSGANIHVDDDYPLRYSVKNGNKEMVKILLDRGANSHANDNELLKWEVNKLLGYNF